MTPEVVNGFFGLAGALLGVAGTWAVTHRYRETKRLNVVVSPLSRLIGIGKSIRSEVEIRYKGQPVEALAAGQVAVFNSGRASIEKVSASIVPQDGTSLVDLVVESTNFSSTQDAVQVTAAGSSWTVNIAFLNPSDKVVLCYKPIGKGRSPVVTARMLGVDVVAQRDFVGWVPDIYRDILMRVLSEMPFFGPLMNLMRPFRLWKEWQRRETESRKPEEDAG